MFNKKQSLIQEKSVFIQEKFFSEYIQVAWERYFYLWKDLKPAIEFPRVIEGFQKIQRSFLISKKHDKEDEKIISKKILFYPRAKKHPYLLALANPHVRAHYPIKLGTRGSRFCVTSSWQSSFLIGPFVSHELYTRY